MINFLLGVASSLVAAVIFALLLYSYGLFSVGSREFALLWSLFRRLRKNGINNFFSDRSEYVRYRKNGSILEYMSTTKRELVYVGLWLSHGTEMTNVADTLTKLIDNGCHLEFVFLDPNAHYLEGLAEYLAIPRENMKTRITQSLQQMITIRNSLPETTRHRLVVKLHSKLTTSSAFLIDLDTESARLLVDFKLYGLGREQTFGIEFGGIPKDDSLYNRITAAFNKVRQSAVPV